MAEIILSIIIAVLCIFGLSEVIHTVKQRILRPENIPETRLIVYLTDGLPDLQLASVVREYKWYGKFSPDSIIAVYSYLEDEELENCRNLAKKYGITLYSLEELEKRNDLIIV